VVRFDATTLWHFDAAEWAPSTASFATEARSCAIQADRPKLRGPRFIGRALDQKSIPLRHAHSRRAKLPTIGFRRRSDALENVRA
jgi:hypothetical protein